MAHSKQVLTGKSQQNARTSDMGMPQNSQHDKEHRLALEQQAELVRRVQSAAGNDPMQSFDSSMTREQVRARFMKLAQRSREGVFA